MDCAETESAAAHNLLSGKKPSFSQVCTALAELDEAGKRYQEQKYALEICLAEYYARILPLTQKLERLRYSLIHGMKVPEPIAGQAFFAAEKEFPDPLMRQIKALYRELVKAHHPDMHQTGSRARPISRVIAAYSERSVTALWLLRIEWECDAAGDAAAYMRGQLQEIRSLLQAIGTEEKALLASPAWRLKERLSASARHGSDLTDCVARRLEAQIENLAAAASALTEAA